MTQPDREPGSITNLLGEVREGRQGADIELFRRVYDELRVIAASKIAGEQRAPADGEATDLANETYIRLRGVDFENRKHLFLTYAGVMRNILIDRARRKKSLKRGGNALHLPLDDQLVRGIAESYRPDAIEGAELLQLLRARSPADADIFELRFFGGLSIRDVAAILGVTEHAVRAGWSRSLERFKRWSDDSRL